MQISVLNLSAGPRRVSDGELRRAIRAINRQIQEDFRSYWNLTGQLRLDPLDMSTLDPLEAPPRLRGDAVIYLVEGDSAAPGRLLGYHQQFNDQTPFGAVFVDVCLALNETWSVALSHEALELLADPDVNLLCKGPHPDPTQAGRVVFHWFELCDAVQAEHYPIDGVEVSNFVLPAYYSGAARTEGACCDFLMANRTPSEALRPFGVKSGGYVGFFDPNTGRDEQYFNPDDQAARRRAAIKEQLAGRVRRFDRRRLLHPLAPESASSPAPTAGVPKGIFLRVRARADRSVPDTARAVIARSLDGGWSLAPFWHQGTANDRDLRLTPPATTTTSADLWDHVYALRADADVESAEPIIEFALAPRAAALAPDARGSFGGRLDCTKGPHDPGTDEAFEWCLGQVKAYEAWDCLTSLGLDRGKGIVVGHPDTGYTDHPELKGRESPGGWNFAENNGSPVDPLERRGFIPTPGHGTGTASVIVSGEGPDGPHVTGVAPDATVMDLRVGDSIVIIDPSNVANAIKYAADHGCHIISMSLSGIGWGFLHDAVKYAVQKGCIVMAAAGNCLRLVGWPAAYEEAIAVAATNIAEKPWTGSSRGKAVDISAPGESVWHALANPANAQQVDRGKGTSFAVATVAGAAALWLRRHGWDNLVARFSAPNVAGVFKQLMMQTAWQPLDWDASNWGPGILHCGRLLRAELPNAPFRASQSGGPSSGSNDWLARIVHQVEHLKVPTAAVRGVLAASLRVAPEAVDERLRDVGQEVAVHLATDPSARDAFEAAVASAANPGGDPSRASMATTAATGPADSREITGALARVGSRRLCSHLAPDSRT